MPLDTQWYEYILPVLAVIVAPFALYSAWDLARYHDDKE